MAATPPPYPTGERIFKRDEKPSEKPVIFVSLSGTKVTDQELKELVALKQLN